jgi:YVTN family beta-propeller protein
VLSPDQAHAYVTNGRGGSISVLDVAPGTITRAFEGVAPRPWGIGVTRDGSTLYVAGGPSNEVVVVDAATGATRTKIPVGAGPWGVVVAEPAAP